MKLNKSIKLFLAIALPCAAANATSIFNFDNDTLGTSTTFTNTNNGVSATFSSSGDPGGFVVYPTIFETLTGNVLGDPGPAGLDNLALNVSFSQNLSAITLNFATADFGTPSPLTLTAYENGKLVGSASAKGQFLPGFDFPEGEIAFSGGSFNQVVISSTATDIAVDNIGVAPSTAPEPSTLALLGAGLIVSGLPAWRRRKTTNK